MINTGYNWQNNYLFNMQQKSNEIFNSCISQRYYLINNESTQVYQFKLCHKFSEATDVKEVTL